MAEMVRREVNLETICRQPRGLSHDAGIGEEKVEARRLSEDLVGGCFYRCETGEIAGYEGDIDAGRDCLSFLDGGVRRVCIASGEDDAFGMMLCELDNDFGPNTSSACRIKC
jgi:hypothetical protein